MEDTLYFTYQYIHKMVKKLAEMIAKAGYRFDVIVAIGTGGFIPARILKTFIDKPILTVGIQYYDENNIPIMSGPKKIQWIDEVEKKLAGKRILLVDEIDDSRTTLVYCLTELLQYNPEEIAVAVVHNKIKKKNAVYPPGIHFFFADEVPDKWVLYPWNAIDIDDHDRSAASSSL